MTLRSLVFLAALLAVAGPAQAQLYKCAGADGRIAYQQTPCPEVAKEKRLAAPPPGPEAVPKSAAPEAPKGGWDAETTQKMRSDCVTSALAQFRKTESAQGFTAEQSKSMYENYCACVVRRASAMPREEFQAKRAEHMARFASEAQKGGECAPEFLRQ